MNNILSDISVKYGFCSNSNIRKETAIICKKHTESFIFFPESFPQLQTMTIWLITLILILLPTPKPRTFLVTSPNNPILLIPFPSVPKYLPTPF